VRLKNDVLRVDLSAYSGSAPVRIEAEISHPGPNFSGYVLAQGSDIPLDEKLFAAVPAGAGEVLRSLSPRGTFNFHARQWRDTPESPLVHQHALITLNRCGLNYERFPYPVNNIRGQVELLDGRWTFRELAGNNDTGAITCAGELVPAAGGQQLRLTIQGQNVPLEEELRDALPPAMQHLWTSLRPRGAVDLTTELAYHSRSKRMSVELWARPRGDSTSIEPVSFPYRLEQLRAEIHYRDGLVELRDVQGIHGRTALSARGQCSLHPDGGWRLRLEDLQVDRLGAEHDLLTAVPERLRRVMAELKPKGPVNLAGTVEFARQAGPASPLEAQWDVRLDLYQVGLECGVRLENVTGGIKLVGSSKGDRFSTRGELALDALSYRDYWFTEVLGPFWIDNDQVLLGSRAEPAAGGRQPRRVTAKLYGGAVVGDCQVQLGPTPQYAVRAGLYNANLAQLAKEKLSRGQRLQGNLLGSLELRGAGRNTSTLTGSGEIRLREADIYELPLMVSLLKILSIRPPDSTAFTKSDIHFRVQGEHIVLDQINFNGDAVSLLGQGQVSFDRQIDLTFHAMVGRDEFRVPVLRGLLGEASQQIMQIRVGGTLDRPETRGEAFPVVSQALQQFQQNLQGVGGEATAPAPLRTVPGPGARR
jgi:hypothetical protein